LNLLMMIAFLISLGTGLVKLPEWQRYFLFVYNYFSASALSQWHDYSGLALIVLIIIHLIVNRKWFSGQLGVAGRKLFGQKNGKVIISGVLVFLVVVVAAIGVFFYLNRPRPIVLSGVEISSYQGEKLGSINDFRENSIKGPQYVDKNKYRLEITGLVSSSTSFSYDEILKLPDYQKVVTLNCVEGWSVKVLWDGVLVKDLFKNLTIKPEAKTVIFYAVDGYSTSFPLEYILNNNIMMADKMNGVVLPPERGFPFQLVAEQKWGYKWIKWINKIELSSDTNYKGFWESRGYSNTGDLNSSQFAP
jgi:cytochrome b561